MLIEAFLNAMKNWREAMALLERAQEDAIEPGGAGVELAEKMERQAAQQVEATLHEFVERTVAAMLGNRQGAQGPSVMGPFILGPGQSGVGVHGPRTVYPPIGDAPIPVCECGHGRDQHLKYRYQCEVLPCPCKEFVKNLSPNATKRT